MNGLMGLGVLQTDRRLVHKAAQVGSASTVLGVESAGFKKARRRLLLLLLLLARLELGHKIG